MSRILIFEDKPNQLFLLRRALEGAGSEILAAEDLPEAERILATTEVDLVVADVRWERGNQIDKEAGLKLLARVKEKDASVQVILVTAYASPEIGASAMEGGAFDILDRTPVGLDFWAMLKAKVELALRYRTLLRGGHGLAL